MATQFDFRDTGSLFGPGGLLSTGKTPEEIAEEEEQQRLLEEQMAAEAAAAEAEQQPDPLAALPEEETVGLLRRPVATQEPSFAVREDQPEDQPEKEEPSFAVRLEQEDKADRMEPDVSKLVETPAFEVRKEAEPPKAKAEIRPEKIDATNNWVGQLKAIREAEIEAEKKRPTRNYKLTPEDAVASVWLKRAVNSPEMWDASVDELTALDQQMSEAAGSNRRVPKSDWEKVVKYRADPKHLGPSEVVTKGEETTEKVTPDAAPTIVQSVKKGAAQTVELVERAKQAVLEVAGADEAAENAGKRAQWARGLQEILPQGTRLRDIRSLGDTLQWLQQTAGEQGVLMAGPIAGGTVGKMVAGSLGAKLGAFGPSWVLGTGEIEAGIKDINPDQKAGLATLAGGTVVAALDSALPGQVGSKLVSTFGKQAGERLARQILLTPASDTTLAMLKRIGTEGLKGAGEEGATEFAQSIIGNVTSAYATGTQPPPDMLAQAIEEGVTGSVMGHAISTTTAAAEEGMARNAPIREIAGSTFTTTPQQQAMANIQQREAAARGQTFAARPSSPQEAKVEARPVVLTPEQRAQQARPFAVRAAPTPISASGAAEKFSIPNAPITSKFGPRHTFVTANGRQASSNHAGIDIGLPAGANAPAGASGVVVSAGPHGGYGNQVVIQHADGTTSSYSHLSKIGVKKGQEIAQGQTVGKVGSTGNATGPHLHLERRDRQGRPVNPLTGGVIQTTQDPDTGEYRDDSDWEMDPTPVDYGEDEAAAEAQRLEQDAAYTEATGQQFEDTDEPPPAAVEPAAPEPTTARTEAATQALDEGGVSEPAATADEALASLDEAKAANPARQALAAETASEQPAAEPAAAAAPAEAGATDYSQPLPGEEPIYAQDESGAQTQEIVGFVNPSTRQQRALGEAPPSVAIPAAETVPPENPQPSPTAAPPVEEVAPVAPVISGVSSEPIQWIPPAEHEGLDVAERTLALEGVKKLPKVTANNRAEVQARGLGQKVALGMAQAPALSSLSLPERTAFRVGLLEGQRAVAKAKVAKPATLVSAASAPKAAATTPARAKSSKVPAPAPVPAPKGKKIPALKAKLAAKAEPAPRPTTMLATLGTTPGDVHHAKDLPAMTEGLEQGVARMDTRPDDQENMLGAIGRGIIRDGDMIMMGSPRWAIERGYADIGPTANGRMGRLTEKGKAKLAELRAEMAKPKEQAQPETKQAEPAPTTTKAKQPPAAVQPAAKKLSPADKARANDIEKQYDKIQDKFFDLQNDGTKSALKAYLKGLVSKGVLDQRDFDSLDPYWKDRDFGVEDVTSDVSGYIDDWKDRALAALSQPVTKRRPSEETERGSAKGVQGTEEARSREDRNRSGKDPVALVGARLDRTSGKGTRPYTRESGGDARPTGLVKATFTPTEEYSGPVEAAGYQTQAMTELRSTTAGVREFGNALAVAKDASPFGAAVYVYSPAEYLNMRLFVSEDGKSGFALQPDGDIVSVFSPGGGRANAMLDLAVQEGGTKLDAFDTALTRIYGLSGFKEYDRAKWDDQYAPDDWNYDTFAPFNGGRPDVVFMKYDPAYSPYAAEEKPSGQAVRKQRVEQGGRGVPRTDIPERDEGTGEWIRPHLNEDGTYTFQHFGPQGLTETDPSKWGTSKSLPRAEQAYANDPEVPRRTHFGLHTGEPGGYVGEFHASVPKYEARIPAERMYDVRSDPEILWVRGNPKAGEIAIKDAGYAGYWYKNGELGLIAEVFEPIKVKTAEAIPAEKPVAKKQVTRGPAPMPEVADKDEVFRELQAYLNGTEKPPVTYPNAPQPNRGQIDAYGKHLELVEDAARKALKQLGIEEGREDLAVQIVSAALAQEFKMTGFAGEFETTAAGEKIIRIIGLSTHNAGQTARHEAIHWMRNIGVITPAEWRTLAAWARSNKSLMSWAEANYGGQKDMSRDDIIEEAVAEGFARWTGGDPVLVTAGGIKIVFDKIRALIQKLAVYLNVGGISRAQLNETVALMNAINSGEQLRKFDAKGASPKYKVVFGRKPAEVAISSALMRGQIDVAEARMMTLMDKVGEELGETKRQVGWHGTRVPTITRFLNAFIGTGEKAQAFGWGLYFAERKSVADWYRAKLVMDMNMPAPVAIKVAGQTFGDYVASKFGEIAPNSDWDRASYEVSTRIHDYLTKGGDQYNGWLDALHVGYDKEVPGAISDADLEGDTAGRQMALDEQQRVAQIFASLRFKEIALNKPAGALYKVKLPENEELLDLDETLGKQSDSVKVGLEKIRGHLEKDGNLDEYEERLNDDFWHWTGHELQMVMKRMGYDDAFPIDVPPEMEAALEYGDIAQAASLWLRELGIPGSRYLDRDSRDPSQPEKTRNYVIFDDAKVELLGKEIPVGTGRSMVKRRVDKGRGLGGRLKTVPQLGVLSDPTNPDPNLFRRVHDQTMAFLGAIGGVDVDAADSLVDMFKRKTLNRFQQIIKTQDRAAEQLGIDRLPAGMNPMEMITADERGYKMEHLLDNQVRPMAKEMAARDVEMADLGLYLYARHAPARNARVAAINKEFRDPNKPGSGMSDAEAAQVMQDFADAGKINDLQAVAVYIDRMIEMAQQERLQSGLLTQDALDAGFQPQDHYVPLRGNENIEPELEMDFPTKALKGGGFSVSGSESHRMFGRESKANLEEIVGYSITQAQQAIDRAYRNKVAKSMYDMFTTVPDSNFVQMDRVKRVATWNKAKGQVEYQMQTRMHDPEEQARTVFFKDGDTLHKMTFNNQNPSAMRFVKATKNLDAQTLGRGLQIMSAFTKLWSKANTQWNVDFILANAVKDVQTGVINASSLDKKGLRRRIIKNLASLGPLRGAWKGEFSKAGAGFGSSDEWYKTYAEFEANGGKLYYGQISQVDEAIKKIRNEFADAQQGKLNPLKWGRATLETIDSVNGAFENMTRLAAYKALRDMGTEPKQAAQAVRELTTNFQQHGEWGPKVNAMYGFANASVVGGSRFIKTVATNPLILTGLLAAGALTDLLNSLLDKDEWDKYTEEEKDAQFMVMMPDWLGFDLKMPVGYGINSFVTTGRKFSELWRGLKHKDGTKLSPLEAAGDVFMSFINAFSPISGATGWNILAPSIVDPFVDVTQNQNNWGKPVYKEQFNKERPDSQASFEKTSQFWKTMAEGMNAWTGGNDILKGYIDLHPETIAHVASETVGGVGRTVMRVAGTTKKLAKGEPISPNDVPVVRRFAGQPFGAGTADEEKLGTFYDKFFDAKQTVDDAKAMAKRYGVNSPEYREFYADNKRVIEAAPKIKIADKRMRAIKAGYNALEAGATNADGPDKKQRAAIFKATGFVVPANKKLTEDQVAKAKERIDAKRLKLAEEFNLVWKVEVLGTPAKKTKAPIPAAP